MGLIKGVLHKEGKVMVDETTETVVPLNTLLSQARQARDLSLDKVASQLNLSITQLEKLEENSLNPTQLSTFKRGYVRNYARLLDIEPEVIDRYFLNCDYGYSELHSVDVYGCPTHKPLLGRLIIKWLLILGLIGLVVVLMVSAFPNLLD
ncbi:hypothetical protein MNBD_GAMMA04-1224 [hydrothermal vent metagenome]|uniref:HTH cro/C1-type domain-containing protein n=1 Tax=hydrothermal vent metagenome TaxID=652676 RepID=A0A3B0WEY9_9ZZZZ